MRIRYISADPAGNLTALTLTQVKPEERAAVAARMMAHCPEGFEQVGFIGAHAADAALPRLDMMGGEFCGNAARAFAYWVERQRGNRERALNISISGASKPVEVEVDAARGKAYAQMPIPMGAEAIQVMGRAVPVVHMEGIDHALMLNCAPSPKLAEEVLNAMPAQDAQGVLFVQGTQMTPLVYVAATRTRVWESSCGSGTVALAWHLAQNLADGEHGFAFDEPGGRLEARVTMRMGKAVRVVMGGNVSLGEEREIEL